ncbi:O-methyltransferase [Dactylosporangium matsuzakiense]|uniref:O-methyltransferase n=1 Tax=Dactylosporangium matsuzakiense TaxID=53360 RepID=A0A9W6KFX3_9ACTN|nr:O-methyltransferase [Dactylosporangium matsuzakiense]UWZ45764.1 class I SAM-dependent methyltransferase [Dactylosporangium matsuzakiense]GLK99954.1 O-methyltransferase [Dactylosporangium matsuzakiense]
MTKIPLALTAQLQEYVVANGSAPDEIVRDLIAETARVLPEDQGMQIAAEQAGFMTLLTRIIGARRAVEIGTFTGLSSIAIARGLADGGKLTCFDVSDEFTGIARRYWSRAGLTDRIELIIGPAADTLQQLPEEPHLDLVFVDADKTGYLNYWEQLVPRVRPGGLLLIDNVLRHGHILDPQPGDEGTIAMVEFNRHVLNDSRVESVLLPIADGLTIARKR